MKILNVNTNSKSEIRQALKRPLIKTEEMHSIVQPILQDIKIGGIDSALRYAKQYDGFDQTDVRVSEKEFSEAEKLVPQNVKTAIQAAKENIEKFHLEQIPKSYSVETRPGVKCSREFRAIENVGIYIPGGTAVLPSTVLMLGIPARIAGCKRVVAISPSKGGRIFPSVLYAAKLCGISEFYKIGGAQGIALLAYGDEDFPKVDKIFGPGNQYVTAAKNLISIDPEGAVVDMPAGPSEVLVIADEFANPKFVASDLLSQAEHGIDSQVVLFSTSELLVTSVIEEINIQAKLLPRKEFISESLKNSPAVIVDTIDLAIELSNYYAPEHLILNVRNPDQYSISIQNAGSVFLGEFTPESAGDYVSGTNHSLPTNGYAKVYGSVSVEAFMKGVTFQSISREGLKNISASIIDLAVEEGLNAHANAVHVRLQNDR